MSEQSRRAFVASGIGAALMARSLMSYASASMSEGSVKVLTDQAIRQLLEQRVNVEKRTVGMAVCVVQPDSSRVITVGHERLTKDRPVTSETVFEIGSITKIFTALLLADMVRRGQVKLDDPVSRHLPSGSRASCWLPACFRLPAAEAALEVEPGEVAERSLAPTPLQ